MSAIRHDLPILIAGGGIAGLALAIALARQGLRCRVLEARDSFSEAGAGIQLGPNATRILADLGVLDALTAQATRPQAINVSLARTGQRIAQLPLGKWLSDRQSAPYVVTHRADLQTSLLTIARTHPAAQLETGFRISTTDDAGASVTVHSDDGRAVEGSVLIGADGLWSTVRDLVVPDYALDYAGATAARTLIATEKVPRSIQNDAVTLWLAPDAHVVAYPVRAGRQFAVVVISREPEPRHGWGVEADGAVLAQRLVGCEPDLSALVRAGDDWRKWALYDPRPLPRWHAGRIGLIGDAAHPILPYLAQGGAMAIEDAWVLARLLAHHLTEPSTAFHLFQTARYDRLQRIQTASRQNGQIYHLRGAPAAARDLGMKLLPAQLLLRRYDWLYGWRTEDSPIA